jgi:hypothetical protein
MLRIVSAITCWLDKVDESECKYIIYDDSIKLESSNTHRISGTHIHMRYFSMGQVQTHNLRSMLCLVLEATDSM